MRTAFLQLHFTLGDYHQHHNRFGLLFRGVEETILVKNLCELPSFNSILPREIITNTITGLAYSLEGVGKTESLKINSKVQ